MTASYELTLVNESELGQVTMAVFVLLPVVSPTTASCVTWLAQAVDPGNAHAFAWDDVWGVAWAASGARQGRVWRGSGTLPADPWTEGGCAATLTYDGDFLLSPALGTPDGHTLRVVESPLVPPPSVIPSSVAVTLAGAPVMAAPAGPNLAHTFTVRPSLYVTVGHYVEGELVAPAAVAGFEPVALGPAPVVATFTRDNTWSLVPAGSR